LTISPVPFVLLSVTSPAPIIVIVLNRSPKRLPSR
jgi:hypothetical protein